MYHVCTNYLRYVSNIPQEKEKKKKKERKEAGNTRYNAVPPTNCGYRETSLPYFFLYYCHSPIYDCLDDYTVHTYILPYKHKLAIGISTPGFRDCASIVNHACYGNKKYAIRIVDLGRDRIPVARM